jgi:hypothetical protein
MKKLLMTLFVCTCLGCASVSLTGCGAGGHIGPVGGSASIG